MMLILTSIQREHPDITISTAVHFLTVFIMPVAMLLNVLFLWFIPLPRCAQKFFYSILEISFLINTFGFLL